MKITSANGRVDEALKTGRIRGCRTQVQRSEWHDSCPLQERCKENVGSQLPSGRLFERQKSRLEAKNHFSAASGTGHPIRLLADRRGPKVDIDRAVRVDAAQEKTAAVYERTANALEAILAIMKERQEAAAAAEEDELRDRFRDLERRLG